MSRRPKVSILLLNWNGLEHLPMCLESLAAQTFRDFEVIVVDNGSRDGSVELVRTRYPWVVLVPLPENVGFASGNNRGLEHASGEYLVTLNNDTRAEPDWLEHLVRVAEAHPRAGMVASRVCSFSDPDLIDSIGMAVCRDGMARGAYRNRRWSSLGLGEVEEVFFPSACAALYKRSMIEETGFFDDDFFAYAEDVDLGLRGRLAGWGAVAATRAVVHHKYSQSSGSLSPFKVYLVERNHYWVAVKNLPWGQLLALPAFTVWRYAEQAKAVVTSRGTGGEFLAGTSRRAVFGAVLRGAADALRGLPEMWKKRRRIMANRRISRAELRRLLRTYRLSFRDLLDNPE
ncbi:MAG: glycosyltransferase family 2 protein [Deferrisomatales bacterium]|nr:glycosyltransferase family 2 protein [Deferrisomatales bacterium]